jgi:Type II secretion system (T2SS), protein E, N-terminal domain
MSLSPEHRSLLMRANRLLGAHLVEANLVKIDNLEAANERLLELISTGDYRKGSVLSILAYELQVVKESDVLQHVMDEHGVGLVDLRSYEVPDDLRASFDVGACWATWTLPFDREEDVFFVATAYYLSPAIRVYWEKQLGGPIVWFGTTQEMLADYFEKLEALRASGGPTATSR